MRKDTNNNVVVIQNQRILLVQRPDGLPQPHDFRFDVQELQIPCQELDPHCTNNSKLNNILLETVYVSIDPAMRGWMSSARSYLPPIPLGSVMRASTICRVLASSNPNEFPVGAMVHTDSVGVQSHSYWKECPLNTARKLFRRLDTFQIQDNHRLSYASFLGVLGTTGLTAYFGFLRVGNPKPSDTVLISGAAGATGSIVAQIAKHVVGCKQVIGTAGTDAKCQWLESNNIVDVAINYKKCPSLSKAISTAATNGVDLVFDNVGSTFLEAALSTLARNAKIVLCGAISQYNSRKSQSTTIHGPRNYMNLLVQRSTMTGFVVLDYQHEFPKAISNLQQWIQEGKIRHYQEDTTHSGIANFYPALLSLFEGTNIGKVVLRVGEEHPSKSRL